MDASFGIKMSKIIVLLSVVGNVAVWANFDRNLHCHEWAFTDNQCTANPRYMWSSCLTSCTENAEDINRECEKFAAAGECSKNPLYNQVNCPLSCGLAISWNPWVRNELSIESAPFVQEIFDEACDTPSDLFQAAELMKSRIFKFLSGGHNSVQGLVSTAPSDFMGALKCCYCVLDCLLWLSVDVGVVVLICTGFPLK